MHNCKEKDCQHKQVRFCKDCNNVYCLKCSRTWNGPCQLNHFTYTFQNEPVWIPNQQPIWISPTTVDPLPNTPTITCNHVQ